MRPDVEDIAAMRDQGDLKGYLLSLIGGAPAGPKPALLAAAPANPGYWIAHTGGWPIGSAVSGPTPTHGRCTCPKCEQAAVIVLPRPHEASEVEAA